MATVIIMPKQGQSVESCIITGFHKKKGDLVSKGDILFSYETDKASFDEESPVDGELLQIYFNEGDEVPVLANVCLVGQPGETSSSGVKQQTVASVVQPVAEAKPAAVVSPSLNTSKDESSAIDLKGVSPRARMLANLNNINLKQIKGSGPNGRVIVRDVEALVSKSSTLSHPAKHEAKKSHPETVIAPVVLKETSPLNVVYGEDYEIKRLSNTRKLIAKAMHASLQNSAQLTHHLGADARRLMALRREIKAAQVKEDDANITINDMVCFATIKALKKFPEVNAHFLGEEIKYFSKVHFGLAVDTDRGLMVPVVKNADDLSIKGLASNFKAVAKACREGGIKPDLLASEAASFTVSNLGNYGVEMFTPVINLPQVAILGVNAIVPRPKDLGDGVYGFVPFLGLSLTYDHRALDGGAATRFLKQVAIEIENLQLDL